MTVVKCKQCGIVLSEDPSSAPARRTPCPECGSTARDFEVLVEAAVTAEASLQGVGFRESKSKWFSRFRSTPSYWRDGGKLVHRYMHLDKRANSYVEKITDPDTGATIYECVEPLSDHTGHGDARRKSQPDDS